MAVKTAAQYEHVATHRDPNLRTGAIVRIKPEHRARIKSRSLDASAPMVAFADKFDMVNCVPVGGDPSGRYHRIPATWLEVIDPKNIVIP